ncbi:hypothetical protein MP228_010076 [Amoeboaphelidium protococcarum]|nr:hypothetical protein MP228_010076 [Amoeboaphelidium protococcarum]
MVTDNYETQVVVIENPRKRTRQQTIYCAIVSVLLFLSVTVVLIVLNVTLFAWFWWWLIFLPLVLLLLTPVAYYTVSNRDQIQAQQVALQQQQNMRNLEAAEIEMEHRQCSEYLPRSNASPPPPAVHNNRRQSFFESTAVLEPEDLVYTTK